MFDHVQPAVTREHDLRALLLRQLGDRERDRSMIDDTRDQEVLAFEQAAHGVAP
jgi:hypothetical protein